MISLVETRNYRCFKYTSQGLFPFNVLIGPNAGGKTTFMDVISFLSDLVSQGLETAIFNRTANFGDLVWMKKGAFFELAVEALIPGEICEKLQDKSVSVIRYEVSIGLNEHEEFSILEERGLLKTGKDAAKERKPKAPRDTFPDVSHIPKSILTSKAPGDRWIFHKSPGGHDHYHPETLYEIENGLKPAFKLGTRKSTFGALPEDEELFPASTWLKGLLVDGVQRLVLNSLLIRKASPPGQSRHFKPDGSNLPWVVERLKKNAPDRFKRWVAHLKTALPDIEDIVVREREDDKHHYLLLRHRGGLEAPSWLVSDGTLRLLALTIPAYLPDLGGVYLIEEPENGIHPRAVETVIQSLSSVYTAQMLLATHSPIILSVVAPDSVLCFARDENGAADIIEGVNHPDLQDWKGEENLGVLYAAGVLG